MGKYYSMELVFKLPGFKVLKGNDGRVIKYFVKIGNRPTKRIVG